MKARDACAFLRAFVAAELFKLRRSRLAKAMIVAMAVASPLMTGVVWLLLGDERMSTFPGVRELIYLPLVLLAGVIGLLLAVEVGGSEFDQDTVRTVVGRGTPRWLFVGGKAVALLVAVTVYAVVGVFSGGFFATISHLSQLGTSGLVEGLRGFFVTCLPAVGIATLVGSAYVGILLLLVALTRSSAPAMLVGLVIFGGDFVIDAIGIADFDAGAYSIYGNTEVLLSQVIESSLSAATMVQGSTTPGWALLTLALYAVAGVVLACCVFKRQDLGGKK